MLKYKIILFVIIGIYHISFSQDIPEPDILIDGNTQVITLETESGNQLFVTNPGFLYGANYDKIFAKKIFGNTLWNDNRRIKCYEQTIKMMALLPTLNEYKSEVFQSLENTTEELIPVADILGDILDALSNLKTNYVKNTSWLQAKGNQISTVLRKINPKSSNGIKLKTTNLQALGNALFIGRGFLILSDVSFGAAFQRALMSDLALVRLELIRNTLNLRQQSGNTVDRAIFLALDNVEKTLVRSEDYWGAFLLEAEANMDEIITYGIEIGFRTVEKNIEKALVKYYMKTGLKLGKASTKASSVALLWTGSIILTVETVLALLDQHEKAQVGVTSATLSYILREEMLAGRMGNNDITNTIRLQGAYFYYDNMVQIASGLMPLFYDLFHKENPYSNTREYFSGLRESIKKIMLVKGFIMNLYKDFFELSEIVNNPILNIVIFDNSGSMGDKSAFSNKTKIDEAKIALTDVVQNSSDNFDWTLIDFYGCNVREAISNTPNKEEIMNEVNRLQPGGLTPIGYSLQHAFELFKDNSDYEKVSIILITDGLETCSQGLPEEVAKEIRKYVEIEEELISFNGILYTDAYASTKLPPLKFFIVGFTTNESENISLQNIAQIAGGKLYTAANLPELKESLQKIVDSIEGKNVFLWTLIPIFIVIIFIAGLILFVFVRRPESAVIGNKEISVSNYYQLFDLLKEQPVYVNKKHFKIGRLPSNDLVLNEKTISKVHAEIFYNKDLGQFIIKNHSVINPIYVNDKKVSKVLLKNNDVIKIARYKFRFIRDEIS